MKWLWGMLVLCALGAAFLFYLGWGRQADWREATGYARLSGAARAWLDQSSTAYEVAGGMPDLYWWGHATVELKWAGVSLISDPVVSGQIKVAPRLFHTPTLDTSRRFGAILISHAHMDHLDNATLEAMAPSRILLPAGSERFLTQAVLDRHEITPVHLGEVTTVGALEVIPVPAAHGGWRYPWQRGLFACGYIVRRGADSIYIAGDTASGAHFAEIGRRYHPRCAVLPIGAYSPEWFLRSRHLNPEEALEAAGQLGVRYVFPYHFGTYRLSMEPWDAPLPRFAEAALASEQLWLLPLGADVGR